MRICPYTSTSCPYTSAAQPLNPYAPGYAQQPPNSYTPPPPLNPPRHKPKRAKIAAIIIGAIFGVILVIAIIIGVLFFGIASIFRNHPSYHVATDYIIANSEIVEIIGEVEGFGFMPIGNLSTSPGRGDANYVITVKGTHGDVRVFIELQMRGGGDWEIVRFSFEPI